MEEKNAMNLFVKICALVMVNALAHGSATAKRDGAAWTVAIVLARRTAPTTEFVPPEVTVYAWEGSLASLAINGCAKMIAVAVVSATMGHAFAKLGLQVLTAASLFVRTTVVHGDAVSMELACAPSAGSVAIAL